MNKDETAAILRVQSSRRRYWWGGVAMLVVGAAALAGGAGFALMHGTEGDEATTAGVAAGFGFGLMIIGAMMAWCGRPGQPIDVAESRDGARREKLQRERTRQLVLYPLVLLLFMAQAHLAMQRVLGGTTISAPMCRSCCRFSTAG